MSHFETHDAEITLHDPRHIVPLTPVRETIWQHRADLEADLLSIEADAKAVSKLQEDYYVVNGMLGTSPELDRQSRIIYQKMTDIMDKLVWIDTTLLASNLSDEDLIIAWMNRGSQ